MTKRLPWWKKHVSDWRAGTRGLSLELKGFYGECLDAQWDLQEQLPLDAKRLAMMLDCNPRSVRKLMPQLIAMGKIVRTKIGYYNPRMMRDILGVETLPDSSELVPVADHVEREIGSNSEKFDEISSPIQIEFDPKVPKNPIITTRDFRYQIPDTESEGVSDARARGEPTPKDQHPHGVTADAEIIQHRAFTISLPAIELGTGGRLAKAEVKQRCLAHAMQWAAEIEGGKSAHSVVPSKIANFLSASLMGELNRAASFSRRPDSDGKVTWIAERDAKKDAFRKAMGAVQ